MNASLSYWSSDYWVGLDPETIEAARGEGYKPEYFFTSDLEDYELPGSQKVVIHSSFDREFGWSDDLEEVIYPCRSSMWFSLQLASYMGFDPIFLLGFDLQGPRPKGHVFEGKEISLGGVYQQLQLMGYLRSLMDRGHVKKAILNCSTGSLCTSLRYHVPTGPHDWSPYWKQ
jgi:hypothetical protein